MHLLIDVMNFLMPLIMFFMLGVGVGALFFSRPKSCSCSALQTEVNNLNDQLFRSASYEASLRQEVDFLLAELNRLKGFE